MKPSLFNAIARIEDIEQQRLDKRLRAVEKNISILYTFVWLMLLNLAILDGMFVYDYIAR